MYVPEGKKCRVKCKEGYEFKDVDPGYFVTKDGEWVFEITCKETWYYGMEFDILDDSWDKYGDCAGDYGYNCDNYPQCGPI